MLKERALKGPKYKKAPRRLQPRAPRFSPGDLRVAGLIFRSVEAFAHDDLTPAAKIVLVSGKPVLKEDCELYKMKVSLKVDGLWSNDLTIYGYLSSGMSGKPPKGEYVAQIACQNCAGTSILVLKQLVSV